VVYYITIEEGACTGTPIKSEWKAPGSKRPSINVVTSKINVEDAINCLEDAPKYVRISDRKGSMPLSYARYTVAVLEKHNIPYQITQKETIDILDRVVLKDDIPKLPKDVPLIIADLYDTFAIEMNEFEYLIIAPRSLRNRKLKSWKNYRKQVYGTNDKAEAVHFVMVHDGANLIVNPNFI
jgi:hypothetical protein